MVRRGSRANGDDLMSPVRCAIYTRKSHEEGLDLKFNSLDQQREAAEAYIESQRGEGWVLSPERYDDAAYSGATLERPALQRLLSGVKRGDIQVVVVYKIDRLSRSLRDFGRLMDLLEEHGASFVSVTQRFDTSSSMGKLTLNVLMSFAEFEREVTRERILDKIAAQKRRGKHTGGVPVLGYDTDREAKRLIVNRDEAKLVRRIFRSFLELGSMTELMRELNSKGHRTKSWVTKTGKVTGGKPFQKSHLYKILHNRKYLGEVEHRGEVYPGEHDAIVTRKLWDEVHEVLQENHKARSAKRCETPALLRGLIRCGHCDASMGPTFTRKRGRTYRYYLCVGASKRGYDECPVGSVAAAEIEDAVVDQLRAVLSAPEIFSRTHEEALALEREELDQLRRDLAELERALEGDSDGDSSEERKRQLERLAEEIRALETRSITERSVADALSRLDPVWDELFPREQQRIVELLVDRVVVREDGIELRLHASGLRSLVTEIRGRIDEGVKAG